jgi:transposase
MKEVYAALDVSDKMTHLCVVDRDGAIVWRGVCATDPEALATVLKNRCPAVKRVLLETGPLSAFLYHGLVERGMPAICVCARHAKGVLSTRTNKSDPHDAEGLAQLSRTGWFKAVRIKQEATHIDRAHLKIREQLTASRQAMANQLRGLLKLFGLRLGTVTTPGKRRERLEALFAQKPELRPVMQPLIDGIEALEEQIKRSTKLLAAGAETDPVTARLMTVPGIGPFVALTYKSSIEDPGRFASGEDVGAYAGLVPRRNQSGERDYKGRISKAGDTMLRSALYEAANILLTRVKRPCALQTWGKKLAETKGPKRARVAVARKLAVLLHRLWQSQTEFCWT